jgi:hypothetical protein
VLQEKTLAHVRPRACELRAIYEGHEVAAHTLTHPLLPKIEDDAEVIRQVEEDRKALSEIAGYEVVGMAYPGGTHVMNEHVADLIRNNTGIKYARTTTSTHNFDLQSDLIIFNPTVYHHVEWDEMFRLGEEFLALKPDTPKIFYIWGHSYEMDAGYIEWERFEALLAKLAGRSDIFYGTNREVFGV